MNFFSQKYFFIFFGICFTYYTALWPPSLYSKPKYFPIQFLIRVWEELFNQFSKTVFSLPYFKACMPGWISTTSFLGHWAIGKSIKCIFHKTNRNWKQLTLFVRKKTHFTVFTSNFEPLYLVLVLNTNKNNTISKQYHIKTKAIYP